MSDDCKLKEARSLHVACDEEECVYWRVAGHLGVEERDSGCAIQHFELLGDPAMVDWLLSVKERLEGTQAADRAESA